MKDRNQKKSKNKWKYKFTRNNETCPTVKRLIRSWLCYSIQQFYSLVLFSPIDASRGSIVFSYFFWFFLFITDANFSSRYNVFHLFLLWLLFFWLIRPKSLIKKQNKNNTENNNKNKNKNKKNSNSRKNTRRKKP